MMSHTAITAVIMTTLLALTSAGMAKDYKGHKFKGTIEAVEDGRLIVRDEEEEPVEFLVAADADITRDEKPASLGELKLGDAAVVTARRANGRFIAVRIFAMEPE